MAVKNCTKAFLCSAAAFALMGGLAAGAGKEIREV
jgi:hypothetical protein